MNLYQHIRNCNQYNHFNATYDALWSQCWFNLISLQLRFFLIILLLQNNQSEVLPFYLNESKILIRIYLHNIIENTEMAASHAAAKGEYSV